MELARDELRRLFGDPNQLRRRVAGCGPMQKAETKLLDLVRRPPSLPVNRRFVRLLGMRRSGNHAIISWLIKSVGGECLHLNNVTVGKNGYRHRDIFPERNDSDEVKQRIHASRFRAFSPLDLLSISYEDHSTAEFLADGANPRTPDYYGPFGTRRDVLLMRDAFNLFASRIRSGKIPTKLAAMDQKAMFIDHARTFLRERDGDRLVCVSYNEWFSDEAYRASIQRRLGIEPQEVERDTVTGHGGGSSFQKRSMDGRASEMDVLARWRSMENDPAFRELFADGELARLSDAIFGDVRART
jgi:hypothetical protein